MLKSYLPRFRGIVFWVHLVFGVIAGTVIGVMCVTGAMLAFENEIVAWAECDAQRVAADPSGTRLSVAEIQRKLGEAHPEFRTTNITVLNDPVAAIVFSAGRDKNYYANPYTGEVHAPASTKVREFLRVVVDWHRFLGLDGAQRPTGKLISGICNLIFCALAITGLYLWWPRTFTWRGLKATALFNWRLSGKSRDFNWHNVAGLWSAPILIVLTLTAVPISFRWGTQLIYRIVGEKPLPPQEQAGKNAAPNGIPFRSLEVRPVAYEVLISSIQKDFPRWQQIVFRLNEDALEKSPSGGGQSTRNSPQSTVVIRESYSWPRTAATTLAINTLTGEILKREGFGNFSAGRQIRTWTRFLHTGQALGWPGQLAASLACLGGCLLVYTGFALTWRRLFSTKSTD